ncbi:chemotaxis protein CheW [Mesoterricola silvestris]|uniref:Chemotaxis protein CheW n=1 Tax=Mesoterricola silvestris TaxID=2927979 RepID=A0AA48GSD1_9BACT|nr:chemotaxis protein CheW [Mesoterricola silvestris]BDU73380.1 chemotaxis protein CheW [Mesoterricola silvestris]
MTQFATFRVGERLFGLDILGVREIIRVSNITTVPRSEAHIRGLINLRGQIVTILDLSVRLGHEPAPVGDSSHIVILKQAAAIQAGGQTQGGTSDLMGLLVDAIGDVVEADAALAEAPPANLTDAEERFLSGVLKTDAGLLVLLNIPQLLSSN